MSKKKSTNSKQNRPGNGVGGGGQKFQNNRNTPMSRRPPRQPGR